MLLEILEFNSYDILIYDPPYIDKKNRKDKKKYENAFKNEAMTKIEDLRKLIEFIEFENTRKYKKIKKSLKK